MRRAFTLFEISLVLAILVVVGVVAWPSVQHAYESNYLKSAATDVQAAFGRARVQAMSSGIAQAFHFEPNAGQYTISSLKDDNSAIEANTASGNATATTGSATATTGAVGTANSAASKPQELPEGIVFLTAERTSDTRTAAADSAIEQDGQSSTAPAIMFYPDGTTSDATVTISNKYQRCIKITLRGLTGVARMSDISRDSAP
jgi:Tfp pilus assembly protein FimT